MWYNHVLCFTRWQKCFSSLSSMRWERLRSWICSLQYSFSRLDLHWNLNQCSHILCIYDDLIFLRHQHTMINHTFDACHHSLDCSKMTFLGFLHESAQQSDTLTNIWLGIVKIPQGINDLFVQCCTYKLTIYFFLNFSPVSNGVMDALQLFILNLFKMSWTYFVWCMNNPSPVS